MRSEIENSAEEARSAISQPLEVSSGNGYLIVKRILDVVFSLVLAIVLIIPLILIALIIRIESRGKAVFCQKRMGRDGKIFTMYKFRTMHVSAPPEVPSREFADAANYTTRFGAFLRRTSIDELPQLFNILIGDMSFVGYRPVCLIEEELNNRRAACGVFAVRPGVTGLAQVSGRDKLSIEEKLYLDAKYVAECSFKTDLICLLKTVGTVISREGVS